MTVNGDSYSDENVDGNGMLTWHFNYNGGDNGEGYVPVDIVDGKFSPENDEDKLTWMLNNGGVTTEVNGEFSPANVEGYEEKKGMLTWLLDDNGEVLTAVNGGRELTAETNDTLTWRLPATENNGDGETKSMLTWQINNNGDSYSPVNVKDDTKGMVTCQLPETEFVVTEEMLTWQNKENEEELSNFLDEAMTCQKTKVKIIKDYLYWLPLKFQTSSAYVTINGNEELCGSSFSDSDTSYMAGISGAWSGLADEARGSMEVEWGECEDEMLACFLGEDVAQMRGE